MDTPGTQPTLTSALRVGERFSIRYRIEGDTHPFTDVIGTIERLDDTTAQDAAVLVRARRGDVRVPLAAIVAVRKVPPAPQPRNRRNLT